MVELTFDLADPPDEPPANVVQPMMWRLAVRLHRDHLAVVTDPAAPGTCRVCGDPWPCPARRIAERGLIAACREPQTGRGAASYSDWFLSTDYGPPLCGDQE